MLHPKKRDLAKSTGSLFSVSNQLLIVHLWEAAPRFPSPSWSTENFNPPMAPAGVPTTFEAISFIFTSFQSTAPVGVPTCWLTCQPTARKRISIHGTREGADGGKVSLVMTRWAFQSTAPVGVPTNNPANRATFFQFQSTAPVGVPTLAQLRLCRGRGNFNPRHPWGCRRARRTLRFSGVYFNPRHPWGCRLLHGLHGSFCGNFNPRHPWGCRQVSRSLV